MDSLEDKLLIRCNTSPAPAQTDTLGKYASDPPTFFETQDFSDERALGTALWPCQQHHLHTHSPVLQVVGKGLYFSPVFQTYTQKVTSSCLVGAPNLVVWGPCKKRNLGHRPVQRKTMRRHKEKRRWPSASQGARLQMKPETSDDTLISDFWPPGLWEN